MEDRKKAKWYYSARAVIIALVCFGPFALPLLFLSPKFTTLWKAIIAIMVVVLTVWLTIATKDVYVLLMKRMEALTQVYP